MTPMLMRFWILLLAVALLAGCGQRVSPRASDVTRGHPTGAAEGAAPPINWDYPGGGIEAKSVEEARSQLAFAPVVPKDVTSLLRIVVSNPLDIPPEERSIAFVYQDPVYGRFFVAESLTEESQADLEAQVALNNVPGVQARLSLVTIRGDIRALVIEGDRTVSLEWLDQGLRIVIMGQPTLTPEDVIAIANRVVYGLFPEPGS